MQNTKIFILLAADLIFSLLIIHFVRYTEIDFSTYLEQSQQFLKGERDYSKIKGESGPLVYPAGHLIFYSFIGWITKWSISSSQLIFAVLYTATTALALMIYKRSKIPLRNTILLFCSRRIRSIFLLRMFNDCVCVFFILLSIYFIQQKRVFAILYSIAVSVKMNALLLAPALLFHFDILDYVLAGTIQVLIGLPFLTSYPVSYITNAFDLSRKFLYVWTVNWKFVPEYVFHSKPFSITLLISFVILSGILCYRKKDVVTLLFQVNMAGILTSRSMHYQFYAWYFFSVPFLLSKTRYPYFLQLVIFLLMELCLNVFPSNKVSSAVLFVIHALILFGSIN